MPVREMHAYEQDYLDAYMKDRRAAWPEVSLMGQFISVDAMKFDDERNRIVLKITTHVWQDLKKISERTEELPMSRVMSRKKIDPVAVGWPTAQTIAELGREISALKPDNYRLDVFKGKDIVDGYYQRDGLGIRSCMTGSAGSPFVEFYNHPAVRLVGLYDINAECYVARALLWLWKDDKVVMRDRVYFRRDIHRTRMNTMVQKLIDDEWKWRGYRSLDNDERRKLPLLLIPKGPEGSVPYFDTMEYAEYDDDTVAIHPLSEKMADEGLGIEDPCCDGGPWYADNDRGYCDNCEDRVYDEDIYITAYGDRICPNCVDNYVAAEPYGDLYTPDDVIEDAGGMYWSIHNLPDSMVMGEGPHREEIAMDRDDAVECDGTYYHRDHPDIVDDGDGNLVHEDDLETTETQ